MNLENFNPWKRKDPEQQEAPTERDEIISTLATSEHANWQQKYRAKNPEAKDRFRKFQPKDEDKAWVKKYDGTPYLKKEKDAYEIDLLNLSYDQLAPSRQYEAAASITVAADELTYRLRSGLSLDNFVEDTANQIHMQWLARNGERLRVEMREKEGVPGNEAALEEGSIQLRPYKELSDDIPKEHTQKEYDRDPARRVLAEYQRRHPEAQEVES